MNSYKFIHFALFFIISYFCFKFLEVNSQISKLNLGAYKDSTKIAKDVKLSYTFSDIRLVVFNVGQLSILTKETGIQLIVRSVSANVSASWHYNSSFFIPIADSGKATLNVSNLDFTITININVKPIYKINVNTTIEKCQFKLENIQTFFYGNGSWLYNLFSETISDFLQNYLIDKACHSIVKKLNQYGSKELTNLIKGISKSMNKDNTTNDNNNVCAKDGSKTQKELYKWLPLYIFNVTTSIYHNTGVFRATIVTGDIPLPYPELNTNSFEDIIPSLYNTYPSRNISLYIFSTNPPTAKLSKDEGEVTGYGKINMYINNDNNYNTTSIANISFIINMHVSINIVENDNDRLAVYNASYRNCTIKVLNSTIGYVDKNNLSKPIEVLMSEFIIPSINIYLNEPIPIPKIEEEESEGVSNIQLEQQKNSKLIFKKKISIFSKRYFKWL